MTHIFFEWDANKNKTNIAKHSISFEEAQTVFYDEYARFNPDPSHSESEDRFLILGYSSKARLVTVCHCYRTKNDTIRIISARKASKSETQQYFQFNKGL
jgi:Uncharacterized protein conserved in bacteria